MGVEVYNGPHNEEQPIIDYMETRYDMDPHYNDPTDPNTAEDFEPEYDDEYEYDRDDTEAETY